VRKRRYRVENPADGPLTRLKKLVFGKARPPFPESVLLETVTACNARCVFCATQELRKDLPSGQMGDALFEKIVVECARWPRHLRRFSFAFDNEPLLDKALVSRIARVKAALPGVVTNITTNGILLGAERVAEIYASRAVDEINVSIQGITKGTYQKLMGVPTYDKVMANVEHLAEVHRAARGPRPEIIINTCLTPETIVERPDAEHRWRALGFRTNFMPIDNRATGAGGAPVRNGRPYHEYCRRPFHSMVICYDGVVPLCCADYRRACPGGDVSRQSLYEIWNGPAMEGARLEMTTGHFQTAEICRTCEMADDGG
jgi:MoaA/NifB/PqqE/SkfB family radical SAM enzyme